MNYIYSCRTDVGTTRKNNQDSLVVKTAVVENHTILMAAVCDGVGGLSHGEQTSRKAADMLSSWFDFELPQLLIQPDAQNVVKRRLKQQLNTINKEVYYANCRENISSGTTLTVLLISEYVYMIGHVGDSRAYAVTQQPVQLTRDHSFLANEVAKGRMTQEEADQDSRHNVILQCIGAAEEIEPDVFTGTVSEPTVFVLCTDGLWHHVAREEWVSCFYPTRITQEKNLSDALDYLTEQVKQRGEDDNITAIAVDIF